MQYERESNKSLRTELKRAWAFVNAKIPLEQAEELRCREEKRDYIQVPDAAAMAKCNFAVTDPRPKYVNVFWEQYAVTGDLGSDGGRDLISYILIFWEANTKAKVAKLKREITPEKQKDPNRAKTRCPFCGQTYASHCSMRRHVRERCKITMRKQAAIDAGRAQLDKEHEEIQVDNPKACFSKHIK